MMEIDAQPFLDAGLDPEKLPDEYTYYEDDAMGSMTGDLNDSCGSHLSLYDLG